MSDFTQEGALNTTGLVLPKASVRRIMKINDEVGNISAVNFLDRTVFLPFDLLLFFRMRSLSRQRQQNYFYYNWLRPLKQSQPLQTER